MHEGSLVAVSSSLVAAPRLLTAVASLVVAPGSRACGLRELRLADSVVWLAGPGAHRLRWWQLEGLERWSVVVVHGL